ncbi:MAG TPA: hypothetical protein VHV30_02175 [Polyangiaceae bacterium]|jgi:hypothetical protein|nr:hypothetical protein [Polyangiaceae bacterium]
MAVRWGSALALVLACAAGVVASGCGTDAVDVDGCRQLEEARCRQAPACGIALSVPNYTSGTNVDACILYYDDACLHGLAVGDPGPSAISACVAAIESTSTKNHCDVVRAPEIDTVDCGWLSPVSSSTTDASDAAQATPTADAATE